jgi:hypothetical protein
MAAEPNSRGGKRSLGLQAMHYKVLQCGWLVFVGPHLDWDGCLRAALGQQGALSHLA